MQEVYFIIDFSFVCIQCIFTVRLPFEVNFPFFHRLVQGELVNDNARLAAFRNMIIAIMTACSEFPRTRIAHGHDAFLGEIRRRRGKTYSYTSHGPEKQSRMSQ
ncbi:uncharacterized protein LDX57_012308 [Aspergillus melleus]|uniref:uncharacterized protein n=1 Tax=Aspergillus melleus TaxID=138277 RepID=UPI001E8DAD88|nr:uncharacterized protein LDX57_012308 [Aspergillus melleus]KAH8434668.1 hypothetical protein LDX57_012308 [Aspergillus melleus]